MASLWPSRGCLVEQDELKKTTYSIISVFLNPQLSGFSPAPQTSPPFPSLQLSALSTQFYPQMFHFYPLAPFQYQYYQLYGLVFQ